MRNFTHYNALRRVQAGSVSLQTRKSGAYYSFVGAQGGSRYLGNCLHKGLLTVPKDRTPRTHYQVRLSPAGEAELASMAAEFV